METANHLGPVPAPGMPCTAFVGYIYQPGDVDRRTYLAHSYTTNTVSVITERNEIFHNIHISDADIQTILFPNSREEMGSPVVCVNIAVLNRPVVVAVMKHLDAAPTTNKEFQKRTLLLSEDTFIDIVHNGLTGTVSTTATSKTAGATSQTNYLNPTGKALAATYVQGTHSVTADDVALVAAINGFTLTVGPKDKQRILAVAEGFTYSDKDTRLNVEKGKLTFSYKGSAQRNLLGEDTIKWLAEVVDEIIGLKMLVAPVPGAGLVASKPIGTPKLIALKTKLNALLSKQTKLA